MNLADLYIFPEVSSQLRVERCSVTSDRGRPSPSLGLECLKQVTRKKLKQGWRMEDDGGLRWLKHVPYLETSWNQKKISTYDSGYDSVRWYTVYIPTYLPTYVRTYIRTYVHTYYLHMVWYGFAWSGMQCKVMLCKAMYDEVTSNVK